MNLASLVAHHAKYRNAKPAIEYSTRILTYGEFDQITRRIAGGLRARGVKQGDLVGIHMKDTPEQLAASFAVMRLGAIVLPMDWRWRSAEIARTVVKFQPSVVLSDTIPAQGAGQLSFAEILNSEPDTAPCVELDRQPAVYAISSGTTGEPKGFVLSHENLYARMIVHWSEFPLVRDDRFLLALPLTYGAGRTFALSMLCLGATVVQIQSIFEPKEIIRAVNERKATATLLPPNVTRALLALEHAGQGMMMPDLRLYLTGMAALSSAERAAVRARVAPHVLDFYASSAIGGVAIHRDEDEALAPESVGTPPLGVEVEIVDDDGKLLPAGGIGRIRVRAPTFPEGVVGDAWLQDEGIRDGWYYSGDFGSLDANGYLYLHGRTTDMIKVGGFAVFSPEIERVLESHPAVKEAAVLGEPSASHGEEVVAFVVLGTPVKPAELIAHCRRFLAAQKLPKQVVVVDALPRNASGKVVKAELRAKS
jgi:acyl-CoA synthetase (AMP-forming)/AMP-acid ligase II